MQSKSSPASNHGPHVREAAASVLVIPRQKVLELVQEAEEKEVKAEVGISPCAQSYPTTHRY